MPVIDPALNQTLWWFVLGAFSGWLLWLLIDRLFWRDGIPADGFDANQSPSLKSELDAARREESLLRSELVREQEETQRLVTLSKELRDKLDGQDQIVANLEAALDAARFSSPGAAAAIASASAAQQASSLNSADAPVTATPKPTSARHPANNPDDGEQALRDLLAQTEANQDLDELLGSDDDLFGAPTEILSPSPASASGLDSGPAGSPAASNGPLSDEELDKLLDLDTQTLFGDLDDPEPAEPSKTSSSDPDSAAPDLGGHTLNMLERLKDTGPDDESSESVREGLRAAERANANKQAAPGDTGLIGRLRGAFSRKPSDPQN